MVKNSRKMPIGAEMINGEVHFRVWAPNSKSVEVIIDSKKIYLLKPEQKGYFSGAVKNTRENAHYQFMLDGKNPLPDPASRFQPDGPHGPSQIIDSSQFKWTDFEWKGIVEKEKAIIYEMHVGTFTQEGTWLAAIEKLEHLLELGVTVIEMMPINEFPGRFNWGYDGVDLFAPTHNYGRPDDLRKFINEAHWLGIGVILDVVYNHLGPDGNYLSQYSDYYFKKNQNDWGTSLNFDGEECHPVREFFIENAGYWIEEFHFDGLRFDACHTIIDQTTPHILLEMTKKVREKGGKRKTFVTAENEQQNVHFVFPEKAGGLGMDSVWNEDFHHAAFVRLTGHKEAYFSEYVGRPQEFISSLKYNFLSQGQWYGWQKKRRGSVTRKVAAHHFVHFLENHDQIANTGCALRLHRLCHIGLYRAMTTLFLLSPQIPFLFQGQEFGSSSPFYYFCDHHSELAEKVFEGRLESMSQFKSFDDDEVKERIPKPHDEKTFQLSKLNWKEKKTNQAHYHLHKDLIEMRKNDVVFSHLSEVQIDGAVLTEDFFVVRYFSKYGERLMLMNLGSDFFIYPASEPLLAPPEDHVWKLKWSSEMPRYGGFGYRKILNDGNWKITGHSASILYPEKKTSESEP